MMKLFKATKDGQVPMTPEEEAQILLDWEQGKKEETKIFPKTLEERITDIENRLNELEGKKKK